MHPRGVSWCVLFTCYLSKVFWSNWWRALPAGLINALPCTQQHNHDRYPGHSRHADCAFRVQRHPYLHSVQSSHRDAACTFQIPCDLLVADCCPAHMCSQEQSKEDDFDDQLPVFSILPLRCASQNQIVNIRLPPKLFVPQAQGRWPLLEPHERTVFQQAHLE